jgi:hypothetical protein
MTEHIEPNDEDTVITVESLDELGWAIGKASQRAKQIFKTVWVYSRSGFYWMTEHYPPEGTRRIAKCYPGGRNEMAPGVILI